MGREEGRKEEKEGGREEVDEKITITSNNATTTAETLWFLVHARIKSNDTFTRKQLANYRQRRPSGFYSESRVFCKTINKYIKGKMRFVIILLFMSIKMNYRKSQ
jgi:hypothetical protein